MVADHGSDRSCEKLHRGADATYNFVGLILG
jgi:hypothetical protein